MKTRKTRPAEPPAASHAHLTSDPYRTMVEDLTETICRFLPDGTFTYVNEVFCRLFGKTREEVVGRSSWRPVVSMDALTISGANLRS